MAPDYRIKFFLKEQALHILTTSISHHTLSYNGDLEFNNTFCKHFEILGMSC